jgi:glutamine amidotransferase-like uncharacterized protein
MGDIVVYADQGVDGGALKHVIKSLQMEVNVERHPIKRKDAKALLSEPWEKTTSLLVIPGGRDVYYQKALAGEGTTRIRQFVADGGSYLGLCAGAYFGCNAIEFEKGGQLEVCAKRELAFYPGLAKGPAYGPNKYSYENERGVEAAPILWEGKECFTYFNGGCFFEGAEKCDGVQVLSSYANLAGQPPAILSCPFGKGLAILTGVHLEYSIKYLNAQSPFIAKIFPLLEKSEAQRRIIFATLLDRLLTK